MANAIEKVGEKLHLGGHWRDKPQPYGSAQGVAAGYGSSAMTHAQQHEAGHAPASAGPAPGPVDKVKNKVKAKKEKAKAKARGEDVSSSSSSSSSESDGEGALRKKKVGLF